MEFTFYTYIIASESWVLYIWMTNNLIRRIEEHKSWNIEWFSKKYKCYRLVYFENTKYAYNAISRENELKGWSRKKKVELIQSKNPKWNDLYGEIIS